MHGCHVEKNAREAREWYRRAVEGGFAEFKLAELYEKGIGGPKYPRRAFHLYKQHVSPEGDLAVARMKAKGLGTQQDRVEAYAWLQYVELYSGFSVTTRRGP